MIETVGAVAQLGEHLLCKQGVSGSIPLSSTILVWTGTPDDRRRPLALRSFASGQTIADSTERQADCPRGAERETLFATLYSLFAQNSFSIKNMLFADLVVMAERLHPIPFRTRP